MSKLGHVRSRKPKEALWYHVNCMKLRTKLWKLSPENFPRKLLFFFQVNPVTNEKQHHCAHVFCECSPAAVTESSKRTGRDGTGLRAVLPAGYLW